MKLLIGLTVCLLFYLNSGVLALHNGIHADYSSYPSHVLIRQQAISRVCGGNIINQNHILTTAYCVLNTTLDIPAFNTILVNVGSNTFGAGSAYTITAIMPHLQYNHFDNNNNIAVIRITPNIEFNPNVADHNVAPVRLQQRIVSTHSECQVPGWAAPTAALPTPPLQFINVLIQDRDTVCNSPVNHNGRLFENMICAGNSTGVPCPSTEGGGIYCNGYLTGVVSHSLTCGAPIVIPAAYIQVRFYYGWIQAQLVNQNPPPEGPFPPLPTDSASMFISSIVLIMLSTLFVILQ